MADTKFTPGPWQWDEPSNWHGLEARVWVREPYGVVAQVPIEAWRPKSVGRANAALIAAAPELLGALKALYTFPGVTELLVPIESLGSIRSQVEAAIAKAEGRQ